MSQHIDGREATQHVEDEADFVIVGSGASGATAARTLAEAGFEVVVLEEGEWVKREQFDTSLTATLGRLVRDAGGGAVAEGRAFTPILQGRCVGGSTVINSAIVWRLPEDVHAEWIAYGLGDDISLQALDANFDQIESDLSVRATAPEIQGPANLLMETAAERLELAAAPTKRYELGCRGSGQCLQGCPHGAKQSMAITYIPHALEKGARLYSCCNVTRLRMSGRKVTGVNAEFRDPISGAGRYRLQVNARKGVLLGASAVQTPALMRRSGISGGGVGDHFQAHPGIPLFGVFDAPGRIWTGATQGYDADHYRKSERFKVETINLPPEMVLSRLPGIGKELVGMMDDFDKYAIWVTQNRLEAQGRVRPLGRSSVRVKYDPTKADMVRVRLGLRVMVDMMFAAGASVVYPGAYGLPVSITKDQASLIDDASLDPRAYTWLATHLFGTARMGKDPVRSVVDTDFQVHRAPNLYVIDSSVFPTNLGVNPQHTIMAMSMLASQKLIERYAS